MFDSSCVRNIVNSNITNYAGIIFSIMHYAGILHQYTIIEQSGNLLKHHTVLIEQQILQ